MNENYPGNPGEKNGWLSCLPSVCISLKRLNMLRPWSGLVLNPAGKFMDIMWFSHHPSLPSNPLKTKGLTGPLTKKLQDSWEDVMLSQERPAPASLHWWSSVVRHPPTWSTSLFNKDIGYKDNTFPEGSLKQSYSVDTPMLVENGFILTAIFGLRQSGLCYRRCG